MLCRYDFVQISSDIFARILHESQLTALSHNLALSLNSLLSLLLFIIDVTVNWSDLWLYLTVCIHRDGVTGAKVSAVIMIITTITITIRAANEPSQSLTITETHC